MGIYSKEWKLAAAQLGGKYSSRGAAVGTQDQITLTSGPWHIVMAYVVILTSGASDVKLTFVAATYVTTNNLRFTIRTEGLPARIGKLLGMQDICVGDPTFDSRFLIRGNDPAQIRNLLDDSQLRSLFTAQPRMMLTVRDDEGLFTRKFPANVDELYFQVPGRIDETETLVGLMNLFVATLNRLVVIGAATNEDADAIFEMPPVEALRESLKHADVN